MAFYEQPGNAVDRDAHRRLDEAREHEHDMKEALDASRETADEPVARSAWSAAREKVAAREAWATWTERGY